MNDKTSYSVRIVHVCRCAVEHPVASCPSPVEETVESKPREKQTVTSADVGDALSVLRFK